MNAESVHNLAQGVREEYAEHIEDHAVQMEKLSVWIEAKLEEQSIQLSRIEELLHQELQWHASLPFPSLEAG